MSAIAAFNPQPAPQQSGAPPRDRVERAPVEERAGFFSFFSRAAGVEEEVSGEELAESEESVQEAQGAPDDAQSPRRAAEEERAAARETAPSPSEETEATRGDAAMEADGRSESATSARAGEVVAQAPPPALNERGEAAEAARALETESPRSGARSPAPANSQTESTGRSEQGAGRDQGRAGASGFRDVQPARAKAASRPPDGVDSPDSAREQNRSEPAAPRPVPAEETSVRAHSPRSLATDGPPPAQNDRASVPVEGQSANAGRSSTAAPAFASDQAAPERASQRSSAEPSDEHAPPRDAALRAGAEAAQAPASRGVAPPSGRSGRRESERSELEQRVEPSADRQSSPKSELRTTSEVKPSPATPDAPPKPAAPQPMTAGGAPGEASAQIPTGRTPQTAQQTAPMWTLDTEQQGEVETLQRQIDRGFSAALRQGGGGVTLRLTPASLGAVRIELSVDGGAVAARLQAGTPQARELLEQNIASLRAALEARGFTVDRLHVQLGAPQGSGQASAHQGGDGGQQGAGQEGGRPSGQSGFGGEQRGGSADAREDPAGAGSDLERGAGPHQEDSAGGTSAERDAPVMEVSETGQLRLDAIA